MNFKELIVNKTVEEIPSIANKVTISNIIILFAMIFIIPLIVGLFSFKTDAGRSKFFLVWLFSIIIISFVVLLLIFKPEITFNIIEFFGINLN